ncbi:MULTISPECIES: TrmB family transcriptional regulator [Natrialbaceae]|uniref:TrmB family transcriptional regulator n=1 Tax=Natrialbaceae TaxID=1644061 RepID=UPI00207CFB76|nr:helix-turn-helix domain-containing protein [Natronococcus sp. CG52]
MTPSEAEALEAFERLGLTSYEAKVFIGLHRIGSGTARDVARVVDVPRSQVYSVAESLEERGLLEVQQSSPIRYRPVSIEEAQNTLEDRFERERDRAFDYVSAVKREPDGEETQEDIWTVRGRSRVDDRIADILSAANRRLVFGTRLPELVTPQIEQALEERIAAGVDVSVVSSSATVRERLGALEGVAVNAPPPHRKSDQRSGRIALVDDDSLLLSVVDDDGSETAIWSADSLFASVLIQLIEASDETIESTD